MLFRSVPNKVNRFLKRYAVNLYFLKSQHSLGERADRAAGRAPPAGDVVAAGVALAHGAVRGDPAEDLAAREIWVLQVVHGRHYAVKRVPDDEVYLNPNHYTIHDPDPEAPGYRELVEYARSRGWYDPRERAFDFALAYQDPGSCGVPHNVHRHVRGLSILMGRDMGHLLAPGTKLPFSVRPPHRVGVETVKAILRTHFEGTPSDVSYRVHSVPGCGQ